MTYFLSVTVLLLALSTSSSIAQDTQGDGGGSTQLVSQLTQSSSDFSQRLYQQVAIGKDNVIYSPFSIHAALSMTSVGARGNTLSEMRTVLGLASLGENTSDAYHDLIVQLNSADKVKLHTANGLFVKPGQQLDPSFIDDVTLRYFAMLTTFNLDADGGPEKPINDFVARKTENMIKNVMEPGSIDASTLMILVNTIFFNGTWQYPFAAFKTRKQDFHQLGGAKKQVDMMNNAKWLRYKRDSTRKADMLEMPFKGNRFSLNILLPHENEGISDIEKTLATNGVDDIFQGLESTYIQISIPKFKIETKLSLAPVLAAMGMKSAFNPAAADFSGIVNQGTFYIDQVIHQAVIDVKETGTVAAAATVVGIRTMAVLSPPKTTFVADHPFLFFLRDSQSGQVLFQGKFSG